MREQRESRDSSASQWVGWADGAGLRFGYSHSFDFIMLVGPDAFTPPYNVYRSIPGHPSTPQEWYTWGKSQIRCRTHWHATVTTSIHTFAHICTSRSFNFIMWARELWSSRAHMIKSKLLDVRMCAKV